jgi:hypothetical protein
MRLRDPKALSSGAIQIHGSGSSGSTTRPWPDGGPWCGCWPSSARTSPCLRDRDSWSSAVKLRALTEHSSARRPAHQGLEEPAAVGRVVCDPARSGGVQRRAVHAHFDRSRSARIARSGISDCPRIAVCRSGIAAMVPRSHAPPVRGARHRHGGDRDFEFRDGLGARGSNAGPFSASTAPCAATQADLEALAARGVRAFAQQHPKHPEHTATQLCARPNRTPRRKASPSARSARSTL